MEIYPLLGMSSSLHTICSMTSSLGPVNTLNNYQQIKRITSKIIIHK